MNKNQDRGFGDFSNIEFVNGDAIDEIAHAKFGIGLEDLAAIPQ